MENPGSVGGEDKKDWGVVKNLKYITGVECFFKLNFVGVKERTKKESDVDLILLFANHRSV